MEWRRTSKRDEESVGLFVPHPGEMWEMHYNPESCERIGMVMEDSM